MRYNRKGSFELTRIFLIRHAEAEGNIYRRAHGQFNGQITGNGFRQIELLRQRFESEKIDAVYSSDLSRAKTTAAAIYVPHALTLHEERDLREVNVGSWEDRAWGNLLHEYPEMSERFGSDPGKWHTEGSEPYGHVKERMTDVISSIARRHNNEAVAVFSHGFAIRSFLCGVLGVPSEESYKVQYCDNTAVTLLSYDGGALSVDYLGDNAHLTGGSSTFAYQTWWREEKDRRSEDMRYELLDDAEAQGGPGVKDYAAFLDDERAGQLALDFGSAAAGNGGKAEGSGTAVSGGKAEGSGTAGNGGKAEGSGTAVSGASGTNDTADGSGSVDGNSAAWIRKIYIKPDFRLRRYGIQLVGQAVSDSRKLRREKLQVRVPADSPEIGFFLKCGFIKAEDSDSFCVMQMNVRNW